MTCSLKCIPSRRIAIEPFGMHRLQRENEIGILFLRMNIGHGIGLAALERVLDFFRFVTALIHIATDFPEFAQFVIGIEVNAHCEPRQQSVVIQRMQAADDHDIVAGCAARRRIAAERMIVIAHHDRATFHQRAAYLR